MAEERVHYTVGDGSYCCWCWQSKQDGRTRIILFHPSSVYNMTFLSCVMHHTNIIIHIKLLDVVKYADKMWGTGSLLILVYDSIDIRTYHVYF